MKKLLICISLLLALTTASLYLFIPTIKTETRQVDFRGNAAAITRFLISDTSNNKWWSNYGDADTLPAAENDSIRYRITKRSTSSLGMQIRFNSLQTAGALHVLPLSQDSVRLEWVVQLPSSYQPLRRWQHWRKGNRIVENIEARLTEMASYLSEPARVYGFDIREEIVVDSILLSTFVHSETPATQDQVYKLVDELRSYISRHGAKETGSPMVNSTQTERDFLIRVAIPVDRRLPNQGAISYKWMMGGGKILVAEVEGGPAKISNAFAQMENYIRDNHRTPPAIPFFSWITDRRLQPDSNRWVTRIYYPVM